MKRLIVNLHSGRVYPPHHTSFRKTRTRLIAYRNDMEQVL